VSVDLTNPVHKKFIEAGIAAAAKKQSRGVGGKERLGKDDFMKILMAEINNQDPFNPMDSKEYGAHLAQFSQLEQMVNMNSNLKQIHSSQGIGNKNELVAYIGKEVHAQQNKFEFKNGKDSILPFNLAKDAQTVDVKIFDVKGEEVVTLNLGSKNGGTVSAKWNGLDKDDVIVPDGQYTYSVIAKNIFGGEVPSDTFVKGKVTGVSFENNRPVLIVGNSRIEPENVMRVFAKTK